MVAAHRMLVEAAPVALISRPPFVVSANRVMSHAGVLSMMVVTLLTNTVVPADPSLRIKPSTFHAAQSVPSDACSRATIVPWKIYAESLGRMT